MTFQSMLSSFIGRIVEVFVPGSLFEGTLTSVRTSVIQVQEPPIVYSQPVTVTIPTDSIEYVRVLL
ncbi:hypothetical protein [Ferroacidibacillus organovorans]|uniref:DUF2642 domain-containing protein n=1 Tax=Ferroacidibacillus organovorans TaxID=1765683 RepID=A0A101XRM7_9BACL|nr:hypothetical protein [Ferroacidibacillus organovorans]KUO96281.1 hypothetical protein ATW55_03465 [Ferroacidibacillus organovorans]